MTIASEITRLQGVKSNIIDAIAAKGVDVPSGAKLADCPELIASISGGGGEFDITNVVPIVPVSKIYVVDDNGYIGYDITKYFQYVNQTIYHNFAILAAGNDFSQMGLGQVTFTPASTDYIGGREYSTVTIGGVTWMAENLDFKFSGLVVGSSGTSSSEPRGNYYNNNESTYGKNGNKYGLLYNWIAVKYLQDNRSLLIPGWHVPSKSEWDALSAAAGGDSVAGTKLKSTTGWSSGNGDGTFAFSAFPAGDYNGSFDNVRSYAYFWTATEYNSSRAYYRSFITGASMNSSNYGKNSQYSVRLVKDSPSA